MITKIITGFDFTDRPTSVIVEAHASDVSWFRKSAAAPIFSDVVRDLKPRKNHTYLHVLALGDGESYGSNRNGDLFPKKANIRYHHTFVKHGNVFKHHDNKDPEKASGHIVASAHNDDMNRVELLIGVDNEKWGPELEKLSKGEDLPVSMSCLVPFDRCLVRGSLVRTYNNFTPVERVKIGDRVLTHLGRFKRVTHTFTNKERRKTVRITVSGFPEPIEATTNHPFFVLSSKYATENQKSFRRRNGGSTTLVGYTQPSFVNAGDLAADDYVLFPVAEGTRTPRNGIDPWTAGLYLADGSLFGQRRGCEKNLGRFRWTGVRWSLGLHEKDTVVVHLVKRLRDLGYRPRVYLGKRNDIVVVVHSRKLAKTLSMWFGSRKTKRLPQESFEWRKEFQLDLLAGWLDGDGCQDRDKKTIRGHSVLEDLARQLQILSFYSGSPAARHVETITGPWTRSPVLHVLYFSKSAAAEIAGRSCRFSVPAGTRHKRRMFYTEEAGGYLALPISGISRELETIETFNLSVEDDETYVVGPAAVHNCSICDNKAKHRKEYCSHLKFAMCAVLDDGKQVCAINDHPKFFDLSAVIRPADRIAYTLRKVAGEHVKSGAELAEEAGVSAPPDLYVIGSRASEKMALARKLAEIEKQIEGQVEGTLTPLTIRGGSAPGESELAGLFNFAPGVPEPCLSDKEAADLSRLPDLWGSLANAKISLPARDFLKIILGDSFKNLESAVSEADSATPGMFDRLIGDEEFPSICSDASYDGSGASFSLPPIFGRMRDLFSLNEAPTKRRVTIAIIRGASPSIKSSSSREMSPEALGLLREYAKYKVSLARRLGDDMVKLSVLQNFLKKGY